MENRRGKNHYVRLGLMIFCSAAAILLFYDTLFGNRVLPGIFGRFLNAVEPVVIGAFIAYLLAPAVNYLERMLFFKPLRRAKERGLLSAGGVRTVSVLLVWTVVTVLVYLLMSVLVPELYKSVLQLSANLENYYNTIYGWVDTLFQRYPEAEEWVRERVKISYDEIERFVTSSLSQAQTLMAAAGRGVVGVFTFLTDLLVGVIASVYFMSTKEQVAAAARRACYALLSREDAGWVLRAGRKADSIFSGFVRGKLLDSLIIGILCFAGCAILDFPYSPLVSVFVGVTNIIPFFGPFIGAIPSAFLILLVSPMKALYFVAFILILQQVDGNIIGPKILGGQTGLSSVWVIVAILVGGSFFGIPGMFFGVPVFACLYSAGGFFIRQRLRNAGLPTDLREYVSDSARWKRRREREAREAREREARAMLEALDADEPGEQDTRDRETDGGRTAREPEAARVQEARRVKKQDKPVRKRKTS